MEDRYRPTYGNADAPIVSAARVDRGNRAARREAAKRAKKARRQNR